MVRMKPALPDVDLARLAELACLSLRWRLPWPLPALLTWLAGWGIFLGLRSAGAAPLLALLAGAGLGALASCGPKHLSGWRRALMGLGFPASALAGGAAAGLPAWAWLCPLAVLLLAYPVHAWRDAPLFPTPEDALGGLAQRVQIESLQPRLLDAGCGLGHGLAALRREFPRARLEGIEWSRPLAWAAAWRCRFAQVRRADMWTASWHEQDLVYLFQRPESMARAWAKARLEMRPGSWLASLEFAVPAVPPTAVLRSHADKPVWLYCMPGLAAG